MREKEISYSSAAARGARLSHLDSLPLSTAKDSIMKCALHWHANQSLSFSSSSSSFLLARRRVAFWEKLIYLQLLQGDSLAELFYTAVLLAASTIYRPVVNFHRRRHHQHVHPNALADDLNIKRPKRRRRK